MARWLESEGWRWEAREGTVWDIYGQETCCLPGARKHLGVSGPPAGRKENEQN